MPEDLGDNSVGDLEGEPVDGVRKPNRQARMAAWAVIALFVATIPLALIGSLRDAKGDPGKDILVRWPAGNTTAVSAQDAERGSVLIPCS